jgi:hypothetical protein
MPTPVRYTAGVSTANTGSTLEKFPMADPTKTFVYFDDFTTYAAADWTVTEINNATQALAADAPFGALVVTLAGAENDGSQSQLTTENFTMTAGKKAWFKTRFKISDEVQSDLAIGLCILDTTILGDVGGDGLTDGIFFAKEDGDAIVDFHVQKNSTTGQLSTTSVTTLTADTYVTLGWYYDGGREIKLFVNDVHKTSVDIGATFATYMPDTPVTVSFAVLAGEGEATALTVDYLFAAIER